MQYSRFYHALQRLEGRLAHQESATLGEEVPLSLTAARAALAEVPIPAAATVVPAGSPFSAYRALRDLCAADVTTQLAWVDAYLAAAVFRRYLSELPPSAAVVLVTSEPRQSPPRSDRERWESFLEVSRLYAVERGPTLYRLVIHPAGTLHDRWLRLDGRRLYTLGGSAKDAAMRQDFALTPVDATPEIMARVESVLSGGREAFGPSAPTHE